MRDDSTGDAAEPLELDADALAALADLRAGRPVSDKALDRLYPQAIRDLSSKFWTPVDIARRAVRLLAPEGRGRVLDMGAGVGRVCLIGALTTESATFTGVEHRENLVEAGRKAIVAAGATRASMVHGTPADVSLADFDAVYFYAPFEENLLAPDWHIDESVRLNEARFREDVAFMEAAFRAAPIGIRIVTFQGFGGTMPSSYRLVGEDAHGFLRAWVKGEGEGDTAEERAPERPLMT
jgi:predicted RNA methylase